MQTIDEVAAKFTITNIDTNSFSIENKDAVNPVTFQVYTCAVRPAISTTDCDPELLNYVKSQAAAYALVLG